MRRDLGLDAARAVAMLGVVLAHAALPYMATAIGWAVRDTSSNRAVDLLVWTARQWLMPTFFLVSGWLGARTVARGGLVALLRQRARRLLVPFALFLVPISLAMNNLWLWGRSLVPRGDVPAPVPELTPSELPVTLGHLWYLYYLIALTLLGALVAAAWRRAPRAAREGLGRAVDAIDRRGLTAPVLALPTMAMLAAGDKLQLDTPLRFVLDPLILAYFGLFYAWGWGLGATAGDDGRPPPPRRRAPLELGLAAVLVAALVPALVASVDGERPGPLALFGAALSSWLLVAGVVDACRRVRRLPPVVAHLALASFWIYIVHLPLVVLLALGASQLAGPGALELAAIVVITLAVTLGSFELVRRTPLGRLFT